MSENELLTTKEAAVLIGCHYATVPDLVKRGHFPNARKLDPTRKNSPLRIPRQDVENFVKSQLVTPEISQA